MPSVAPTAGQVLSSSAAGVLSWISIPSAPVTTVFGRSGAVTATAGDYTATLVTNTPAGSIAGTTVQAALNELDTEKQGLITAGTTAQYYRGDKTFVDFGTDVRGTALTGYAIGANTALTATDTTLAAFQKVQGQINATNTAVAGKEPAITAGTTAQYIRGDKTLSTFGTDAINSVTGFITVPTPINPNDAANKAYVDGFGQWLVNGTSIYYNGGNVGIGTSTPFNPLMIGGVKGLDINHNGSATLQLKSANASGTHSIIMGLGSRGTISSPTVLSNNDYMLQIMAGGYQGSGYDAYAAGINFINEAVVSGQVHSSIGFNTSNTANADERMRITSTGNVGIGVTNPQQKFVVQAGNLALNAIGNASPQYEWRASDNSLRAYISHATETPGATTDENRFFQSYGYKTFYTQGAERLRIDAAGNVGIGTTTPTQKLTVAGTIESTSGGIKFPDGSTQTTASIGGQMQRGRIGNCTAGNAGSTGSVTFATAFSAIPIISVTPLELDNSGCTSVRIIAHSTTGFTWNSFVGGTGSACDCINWTAIEP